jgi:hypothetical protein
MLLIFRPIAAVKWAAKERSGFADPSSTACSSKPLRGRCRACWRFDQTHAFLSPTHPASHLSCLSNPLTIRLADLYASGGLVCLWQVYAPQVYLA